jgi:uncharacterized spore protein YtfJ
MSTLAHAPNVFQNLNESIATSGTNKTVFGEPVTSGDIKVIPVARVAYGFGGGSGILSRGSAEPRGREGMGGGGGVMAIPVGVVEITPNGTHWIPFGQKKRVALAFAAGALLGLVAQKLR